MNETHCPQTRLLRRYFLQGMVAAASLPAIGALPAVAFADEPAASSDFMAVSKVLAGNHNLKPQLAAALYRAFKKTDANVDTKLARMVKLIGASKGGSAALKAMFTGENADLDAFSKSILTGWYLGIVGTGKNAICVAFVDALANEQVADILRPQSYSYGAYGSWAAKPA